MRPRKKPQVNPRTLRKASQARKVYELSNAVAGERIATKNGYRINGTSCKDFETYFEHIGESQMTAKVVHEKKTRSYRVVSGQGFAILEKDGQQRSLVMRMGTEVTVEPGIACQLATTSINELEVFVIQSAKYDARAQVLKESETEATLDPQDYVSQTHDKALQQSVVRRRNSKAAQQQSKLRSGRKFQSGQIVTPPANVQTQNDANFTPNLRPTGGRDMRGAEG